MHALEGSEQVRHEVFGAGLNRQLQVPLQGPLHVGELHIKAFQAAKDVAAGTLQGFCSFGKVQLLADILEQRLPHQFFELTDL
ncbi:hypothetical protein D3C79_884780 [compost metagenome]